MFLTELVVKEPKGGEGEWELVEDLIYKGHTHTIVIPKGFKTDFASVPRIFWNILPPFGRYTKAAVLHDFLYRKHPILGNEPITKDDADGLFRRTMKELKTPSWKIWVIYKGVHWFGKSSWKG